MRYVKKTKVQVYKYYHDSGLEAVMLLRTTKIKQRASLQLSALLV